MPSPSARVQEFLRQWAMMRDKSDIIYGVLADPEQDDTADLLVSDLHTLLANQRTPEQARVLSSAVQEYRAGHKSDLATAKDPATLYTAEDRAEYQRALQEHYTAVRAYIQAQAKEQDVRP